MLPTKDLHFYCTITIDDLKYEFQSIPSKANAPVPGDPYWEITGEITGFDYCDKYTMSVSEKIKLKLIITKFLSCAENSPYRKILFEELKKYTTDLIKEILKQQQNITLSNPRLKNHYAKILLKVSENVTIK